MPSSSDEKHARAYSVLAATVDQHSFPSAPPAERIEVLPWHLHRGCCLRPCLQIAFGHPSVHCFWDGMSQLRLVELLVLLMGTTYEAWSLQLPLLHGS